jgi:hypothetical protein
MALLVVLESLTPLERAVFVLHEVFGFPYAEIAEAVERSEDTVRQAAHRARGHIQARRPRFHTDPKRRRDVTDRFLAAASGGDVNTLMQLLHRLVGGVQHVGAVKPTQDGRGGRGLVLDGDRILDHVVVLVGDQLPVDGPVHHRRSEVRVGVAPAGRRRVQPQVVDSFDPRQQVEPEQPTRTTSAATVIAAASGLSPRTICRIAGALFLPKSPSVLVSGYPIFEFCS